MQHNRRRSARAIAIARADEAQSRRTAALYALVIGASAAACFLALPFLHAF